MEVSRPPAQQYLNTYESGFGAATHASIQQQPQMFQGYCASSPPSRNAQSPISQTNGGWHMVSPTIPQYQYPQTTSESEIMSDDWEMLSTDV